VVPSPIAIVNATVDPTTYGTPNRVLVSVISLNSNVTRHTSLLMTNHAAVFATSPPMPTNTVPLCTITMKITNGAILCAIAIVLLLVTMLIVKRTLASITLGMPASVHALATIKMIATALLKMATTCFMNGTTRSVIAPVIRKPILNVPRDTTIMPIINGLMINVNVFAVKRPTPNVREKRERVIFGLMRNVVACVLIMMMMIASNSMDLPVFGPEKNASAILSVIERQMTSAKPLVDLSFGHGMRSTASALATKNPTRIARPTS